MSMGRISLAFHTEALSEGPEVAIISETEEKKEDFRGINMIPTSRDRSRIDVLHGDESVEARSAYLLEELKCGRLTVSDLMGPLYGVPNLTPSIVLPPGQKVFA